MDDSIIGLFVCIGIAVGICLLIGVILAVPVNLMASHACESKAHKLGLEYDYGMFQGCFVKQGNQWIDYNNYRVILDGK